MPCSTDAPEYYQYSGPWTNLPISDQPKAEFIQTSAVKSQLDCVTTAAGCVYYTRRGRLAFALGSPMVAINDQCDAAAEFEAIMAAQKLRCVYFGVENPQADRLAIGRRQMLIGSQPILTIGRWREIKLRLSGLRAQIKRGQRGITIVPIPMAKRNACSDIRAGLGECLTAWLESRPAVPMGFAADARLTTHLHYYHSGYAAIDSHGTVQAYVCLSQVAPGDRFLLEHIIRRPEAPNGVVEALIDHVIFEGLLVTSAKISLGLTALSERYVVDACSNPWMFRLMRRCACRWGNRLYNFTGLERFRHRLCPAPWEPIYILSDRRITMPELALGMARLFFSTPERRSRRRSG